MANSSLLCIPSTFIYLFKMFSQAFFCRLAMATALLSQQCAAQFPFGGDQLETVTNWGDNPTGLEMQIYKPSNVAENPAVIFAVCLL